MNPQSVPLRTLCLQSGDGIPTSKNEECCAERIVVSPEDERRIHQNSEPVIALIYDEASKEKMYHFVLEHELELSQYGKILSTESENELGNLLNKIPNISKKLHLYTDGSKGGYIGIATETLLGRCDDMLFFVDSVEESHYPDLQVVFGSAMINHKVRILRNIDHAREWMKRGI